MPRGDSLDDNGKNLDLYKYVKGKEQDLGATGVTEGSGDPALPEPAGPGLEGRKLE